MRPRRIRPGGALERLTAARMKRPPDPPPAPLPEDPLLDALRDLPAGSVYALASKNEVAEGFRKFAREEVRRTVDDAYRTKTEAQARVIALTAILKLRQLCLSPALLAPGTKEPSPKVSYLLDKAAELAQEGHSALVFSQFTSFLDLVGEEPSVEADRFLPLDHPQWPNHWAIPPKRWNIPEERLLSLGVRRIVEDSVPPEAMDELLRAFRSWKSTS